MIYIVRGNRLYVFSTMWIIGPIAIIILYKSIKKIEEERAEYYKAEGIKQPHDIRGGQQELEPFESELVPQLINVTKPGFICLVREGVSYVKSKTYKKLVIENFSQKAKNGVSFIAKSALCQSIALYGLDIGPGFLNVIGLSSWVNPVRNTVSVTTAAYGVHLIWCSIRKVPPKGIKAGVFSKNRRIRFIGGIVSLLISLVSMSWSREPGIIYITSTYIAIDGKVVSIVKPRIEELMDVVVVNSENANKALTITNEVPSEICKIPGVAKVWKKCPPKITFSDPELGVKYHEMGNMNDIVKFSIDDSQQFNDLLDVGNPNLSETVPEPPRIKAAVSKTARLKAKVVHFLDKFKDPEIIPEDSLWETSDEISSVAKTRIRNKK